MKIVMPSVDERARRKRHRREVLRAEDFSEDDLEKIAASKVPEEFASLDEELADWQEEACCPNSIP